MPTQALQRIECIDPDEYPHLLLGFLDDPIKDLGPKAAIEELHHKIFRSYDHRLEKLATAVVCYFVNNGRVDRDRYDDVYGDLLSKLKLIRDRWVQEQLRAIET